MGYWSSTQQAGFLASFPVFIFIFILVNLLNFSSTGNVYVSDVTLRTLPNFIPVCVGLLLMYLNKYNGLSPLTEGIILASQSLILLITMFTINSLPELTGITIGRKVRKAHYITFIGIIFLGTLGLTINQFIGPKGDAKKGESTFVKYNRHPCKSEQGQGDQEDDERTCKVYNICKSDPKSKECVCEIDSQSKACIEASKPKAVEGFNGNLENKVLDIGMENFYRHAQDTNRTSKLIFGT